MEKETNRFRRWYGAHVEKFIPHYAFFSFVACFLTSMIIYGVTQRIASNAYHYDFTTEIDRNIPFQPEWVLIYILSYVFWLVNYALTARTSTRENWFRFVTADLSTRIICGVFFVLLPTTNVRPTVVGEGIIGDLMNMIYGADLPYNLFPSIHCVASLMCYLGIRQNEGIPQWYKDFSLLFAILIFASTQFTKQHYLVDVVGGIIVAVACFSMAKHTQGYKKVYTFFDRINVKVFGRYLDEE